MIKTPKEPKLDKMLRKAFGLRKNIANEGGGESGTYSYNIPPLDHSRDYDGEVAFFQQIWQDNMPPGTTPDTFKDDADRGAAKGHATFNFANLPNAFDPLSVPHDIMYTRPILAKLKRGEKLTNREQEIFLKRQQKFLNQNVDYQLDRVKVPQLRGYDPRIRRQRDAEHEVYQIRMDQMGIGVGRAVRERYPDAYRDPQNGQIIIPSYSQYKPDPHFKHPDYMQSQIDNPAELGAFDPHKRPNQNDPKKFPQGHGVVDDYLTDLPILPPSPWPPKIR